jgi:hypothetical protein
MANAPHGNPSARGMQDQGGNLADKAKDTATSTMDRAKDVASHAADKAKDFGRSAADMAENATSKVGSGIESMAGTLRDKAPHEGMVGTAAGKVADTLERGGRYLQEEGLSGIADDVTDLIKRNPIPALLVGVGIGFLLAQALRR